ncbi:MAG: curli-like amyloid fiber formation chaperone CsgH [Hyphomonadaceae bacterium]|nr:curli-like amyloid fiber formation chaperone CsgH [Hyphomonadaceae bacterium]
MSRHLIALTAVIALAGCSAGMTAEAVQEAYAPPEEDAELVVQLDGAPPVLVAEAPQTARLAPPPVVVRQAEILFCDIAVVKTSHGVRITPVVRSDRSLSGEFSIVITKNGKGGSSDISQGGPFDAARGVKQELGSSEISLERGASFRAVLKVRAGGREVCRDIRS